MFKIIEEFLENPKHKNKLKYAGAFSGLCGVFLAIPTPTVLEAKTALANIQLFWLVLLTLSLSSLFGSFIVFTFQKEKKISHVYDFPIIGTFSLFIGAILLSVIINLWRYILSLYTDVFAMFTVNIGFPAFITLGAILLTVFLKKREEKIPLFWILLADSLCIGALFSVTGFYLQEGITKLFYFYWFYPLFPIISFIAFVLVLGLSIYRKYKIFKPYVSVQR